MGSAQRPGIWGGLIFVRSCYEAVLHDLHRPGEITLGKAGSCLTSGLQLHYQIHQHCAQSMESLQCICI